MWSTFPPSAGNSISSAASAESVAESTGSQQRSAPLSRVIGDARLWLARSQAPVDDATVRQQLAEMHDLIQDCTRLAFPHRDIVVRRCAHLWRLGQREADIARLRDLHSEMRSTLEACAQRFAREFGFDVDACRERAPNLLRLAEQLDDQFARLGVLIERWGLPPLIQQRLCSPTRDYLLQLNLHKRQIFGPVLHELAERETVLQALAQRLPEDRAARGSAAEDPDRGQRLGRGLSTSQREVGTPRASGHRETPPQEGPQRPAASRARCVVM